MRFGRTLLLVCAALVSALLASSAVAQTWRTIEEVNCDEVTDCKKHGRSGKSYYGVATGKGEPYDQEVLRKAEAQFAAAMCEETGDPTQWEWNMFMGMIKAELKDYKGAAPHFNRAIENAKKDKDRKKAVDNREHFWVDLYNEGLNEFNQGLYDQAAEAAELAIALNPEDCRAYTLRGPALIQLDRFGEAVKVLEAGTEICPNNESLAENLFAAYHNRGNKIYDGAGSAEDRVAAYREAADFYEKADAIDPESLPNLYQLGAALLQVSESGDSTAFATCEDAFNRFIGLTDKDDDKAFANYNLAILYMNSEQWDKAGAAADAYSSLKPFDPDGYSLRAKVMMNTGREDQVEPFIILANCLKEDPQADVESWCNEAKTRYGASSGFSKVIGEHGTPTNVWVYIDSSDNQQVAVYYDSANKVFSFYAGDRKGDFDIAGNTEG